MQSREHLAVGREQGIDRRQDAGPCRTPRSGAVRSDLDGDLVDSRRPLPELDQVSRVHQQMAGSSIERRRLQDAHRQAVAIGGYQTNLAVIDLDEDAAKRRVLPVGSCGRHHLAYSTGQLHAADSRFRRTTCSTEGLQSHRDGGLGGLCLVPHPFQVPLQYLSALALGPVEHHGDFGQRQPRFAQTAQENGTGLLRGAVEPVSGRPIDPRRPQNAAVVVETQGARSEADSPREGADTQ